MKRLLTLALAALTLPAMSAKKEQPLYKNPKASVAQRVDDLLARMTPRREGWADEPACGH